MSQINLAVFKVAMKGADAPCNRCGSTIKRTNIHHIDHNPQNDDWENFEVLCIKCHREHHSVIREAARPNSNTIEYKHLVIPRELHQTIKNEALKNNTTMTKMLSAMFRRSA